MAEIILEVIASFFQEALPSIVKFFGALIRWCFFLGKKKLNVILKEDYNKRVGFFSLVIIIVIIIGLNT